MAMEFVKKEYENVQKEFNGKIVIGVKKSDGGVHYNFYSSPLNSLQGIKRIMTDDMYKGKGIPEIVYVGKVKLEETERGLEPTLEEVDMSKVKLEKPMKIPKSLEKEIENEDKKREEKRRKLSSYSSKIPNEIKSLFEAMNSENSYAIMACLLKEGEQTHPQLKEKLGLDDRTLIKSLNKMTMLVDQMAPIYDLKDRETGESKGAITGVLEESTYSVSELGRDFMKNVYATFEVPEKKK